MTWDSVKVRLFFGFRAESGKKKRRDLARRPSVSGLERRELLSTVSVDGRSNIYGAGLKVVPDPGGGGGGLLPVLVNLSALGNAKTIDFPSATGKVSGWANGPDPYNGPDGGPYWGGVTNVPAWGGISGSVDSKATMYLVGVFLGPNGQPARAPATLNVTNANASASFSPLVGQQFFIGDGRTTAKALQSFHVPAGATRLYLGFTENFEFHFPTRLPGFYNDNGGKIVVDVEPSTSLNANIATFPGAGSGSSETASDAASASLGSLTVSLPGSGDPSVDPSGRSSPKGHRAGTTAGPAR